MRQLIISIVFLLCINNYAQSQSMQKIHWVVTDFVGEPWYAKPDKILGKSQSFYKGFAEGVFYSCDFAGQSFTRNTYTHKEFFSNKEFSLFLKHNIWFDDKHKIYVHRITCNGKKGFDRKVMYPIVAQHREQDLYSNNYKSYYLFEGAIYTLTASFK